MREFCLSNVKFSFRDGIELVVNLIIRCWLFGVRDWNEGFDKLFLIGL